MDLLDKDKDKAEDGFEFLYDEVNIDTYKWYDFSSEEPFKKVLVDKGSTASVDLVDIASESDVVNLFEATQIERIFVASREKKNKFNRKLITIANKDDVARMDEKKLEHLTQVVARLLMDLRSSSQLTPN